MHARDIMTSPVVTVPPDLPVQEAAAVLVSHGFTALPVVDSDGGLIGIVTEADLVRGRYTEHSSAFVADVLTTPVIGMAPGTPAEVLARVMLDDRLRCIPIVDGSRVVGVVTRRDLVRAMARPDSDVAEDVLRRLDIYGGGVHWAVAVQDGAAVITADFDDPISAEVVTHLAEAVPGVVSAEFRVSGA
jgi:CBS domain-containing protein